MVQCWAIGSKHDTLRITSNSLGQDRVAPTKTLHISPMPHRHTSRKQATEDKTRGESCRSSGSRVCFTGYQYPVKNGIATMAGNAYRICLLGAASATIPKPIMITAPGSPPPLR